MENAIILARCSTTEAKQDVTRQTTQLRKKYKNQYNIVKEVAYYQSGLKNQDKNSEVLMYVVNHDVQHIIVSELSRISRRTITTLQFIETCTEAKVNVIIDNYGLNSLTAEKTVNEVTHMMLTIGASFAQMELRTTLERLQSGRRKYIEDGGTLGRKIGSTISDSDYLEKHKDVLKELKLGTSIRKTMKITGKSSTTVKKIKRLM